MADLLPSPSADEAILGRSVSRPRALRRPCARSNSYPLGVFLPVVLDVDVDADEGGRMLVPMA